MEDRVPNLLKNVAKWLFGCAGVVFLVGMGWLYIEAPCSNTGAYIVFTAVGMGVAAFCCLSIRSLLVRTRDSLLLAGSLPSTQRSCSSSAQAPHFCFVAGFRSKLRSESNRRGRTLCSRTGVPGTVPASCFIYCFQAVEFVLRLVPAKSFSSAQSEVAP
jgi:hypothetical protein